MLENLLASLTQAFAMEIKTQHISRKLCPDYGKIIRQTKHMTNMAALYLTLVSDRHFRILTQIMTFEAWDALDIWSEWWAEKYDKVETSLKKNIYN